MSDFREHVSTDDYYDYVERVRLRVYKVLGHGGVTQIARSIGRGRAYVSSVLNGTDMSRPILKEVSECLDEIERERALERAA